MTIAMMTVPHAPPRIAVRKLIIGTIVVALMTAAVMTVAIMTVLHVPLLLTAASRSSAVQPPTAQRTLQAR